MYKVLICTDREFSDYRLYKNEVNLALQVRMAIKKEIQILASLSTCGVGLAVRYAKEEGYPFELLPSVLQSRNSNFDELVSLASLVIIIGGKSIERTSQIISAAKKYKTYYYFADLR